MSWVKNNEWLRPDEDDNVRWPHLARFLRNYRPFRALLLAAALLVLFGSVTVFLIPLIFRTVQAAITAGDVSALAVALGGFLAISLVDVVTTYGVRRMRARVSTRLNRDLVLQYYRKILNLAVEDFIAFRQRTNLFQRLIDAMTVTDQFTDTLIRGGQGVIIVVVTAAAIGIVSPTVLAVLLAATVVLFVHTVSVSGELRRLRQETLALNYPLVGKMTEIIDGLFTIKALAASVRVSSDVLHLVDGKMGAEYREQLADVRSSQVSQGIRSVSLVAGVATSCALMMQGDLLLADVVSLYILANLLLGPVTDLAARYHSLSKLSVNVAGYYEVLDLQEESAEEPPTVAHGALNARNGGRRPDPAPSKILPIPAQVRVVATNGAASTISGVCGAAVTDGNRIADLLATGHYTAPANGRVSIRDVSFAYRGGSPVLHDLNLEIAPGEHVSLIGRSGVGKTTLLRLLLGFLQPQQGALEVDGRDIASYRDKNEYRRRFGVVSQRDVFFGVSLRENLTFGLADAPSDDRIEEAARMVDLWDTISRLDGGLDSTYSADRFSGGQKQRLYIARALLRDPSIVLLDEPTSALDFENEKLVVTALERLVGNKTTITIAHRLSTVRSSDRVILLEGGTLKASGTHEELYETDAYYRALCEYNSFMV